MLPNLPPPEGVPRLVASVADNLNEVITAIRSPLPQPARSSLGDTIANASFYFGNTSGHRRPSICPRALPFATCGLVHNTRSPSPPSTAVFRKQSGLRVWALRPFATGDFAFWNGDMTLDYNYQLPMACTLPTSPRRLPILQPIVDGYAARAEAQATAKEANVFHCGCTTLCVSPHHGATNRSIQAFT